MQSSEKLSKTTSRGLLSQLSQARSLFHALKNQSISNDKVEISRVKTIVLKRITPFIENQQLIPGLSTGLRTVLSQVSDNDIVKFLDEMETLLGDCIDEIQTNDATTADLDMQDRHMIDKSL